MRNRIVITGGSGFIGSHLVENLIKAGFDDIVVLDKKCSKIKTKGVKRVNCDIFENTRQLQTHIHNKDIVVHLACSSMPASSSEEVQQNHSEIAHSLLQICAKKGVRKFIFSSSGGTVYGEGLNKDHLESDYLLHTTNPYATAKVAMEKLVGMYDINGMTTVILRIANPYGRKLLANEQLGAVDVFLRRAMMNKPIMIWGDGSLIRDYIHIDDVVSFFLRAIKGENVHHGIYNVGSGTGTSLKEIVKLVEMVTRHKVCVEYLPARFVDVLRNVLNIEKACSTGWRPVYDLTTGIQKLYEDLRK